MDYQRAFSIRAESYFAASKKYPHILADEYKTAISHIRPRDGDKILHISSIGVNIKDFVDPSINVLWFEVECNETFAKLGDVSFVNIFNIPFEDETFDTIIHLASLHHFTHAEREKVYGEMRRLLRPGGKYIIGDVEIGSQQDKFLNEFVDKFNPFGHKGVFFCDADASPLLNAGFSVVSLDRNEYLWKFHTYAQIEDFCYDLFYLRNMSNYKDALISNISEYLEFVPIDTTEIGWKWKLIYFIAYV